MSQMSHDTRLPVAKSAYSEAGRYIGGTHMFRHHRMPLPLLAVELVYSSRGQKWAASADALRYG